MAAMGDLIIYLEENARVSYESAAKARTKKQRDEDQMRGDIFSGVLHRARTLILNKKL